MHCRQRITQLLLHSLTPLMLGTIAQIPAYGQAETVVVSTTGSPSGDVPGSYYSGTQVETVNLLSGTVSLQIPLLNLKGRGLDSIAEYHWGSGFWTRFYDVNGLFGFEVMPQPSQFLAFPHMGQWAEIITGCLGYDQYGNCNDNQYSVYFNEYDGTAIQLGGLVQQTAGTQAMTFALPLDYPSTVSNVLTSADGSYVVGNLAQKTVRFPDGSASVGANGSLIGQVTDRNGNTMKCTSNASGSVETCVDSIGRSIQYSGNAISYRDSNGNVQSIAITSPLETLEYPQPSNIGSQTSDGVLSQIVLGNGQSYHFQYDTNSDGNPTGEINRLILPTGGYIRYVYNYRTDGVVLVTDRYVSSDGTSASEVHYHYDYQGSSQFGYGNVSSAVVPGADFGGTSFTNTITYPDGSKEAVTWSNNTPIPSGIVVTDPSGKVLRNLQQTVTNTFSRGESGGEFDYSGYNNPQISAISQTLDDGSVVATNRYYDYYSNITEEDISGSDSSPAGASSRTTLTAYYGDSNSAYSAPSVNLLRLPSSISVSGSGGNNSVRTYTYDECCLSSESAAVGHDDADYPSTFTLRGNVTTEVDGTGSATATTHITYDYLGNVLSKKDPLNHVTTYSYGDVWGDGTCAPGGTGSAVPSGSTYLAQTKITNPLSQNTTRSYYSCSGLIATEQNPNDIAASRSGTNYSYNAVSALTAVSFPDGSQTTTNFHNYAVPLTITTTVSASPSGDEVSTIVYDGLGRPSRSEANVSSQSTTYTDTSYDILGNVAAVSNPYPSSGAPAGFLSYVHDILGRLVYKCNQDNGTAPASCAPGRSYQRWSYSGKSTTFTDETGSSWTRTADALGRLIAVADPSGAKTYYGYDGLGNLTCAAQDGGGGGVFTSCAASAASWRPRSFTYDALSRLQSSTNPETGAIGYSYYANGMLLSKTDARNVATTYAYDALDRMISKSFTNAPAGTLNDCFQYDNMAQGRNGIGRLWFDWTQSGSCPTTPLSGPKPSGYQAQRVFGGYDARARVVSEQQCVNGYCTSAAVPGQPSANCTALSGGNGLQYCYDLAGNLLSYGNGITIAAAGSYPQMAMAFWQTFDLGGRLATVNGTWSDASHPSALFSQAGYSPANALSSWLLGGNLYSARNYDSQLRICSQLSRQQQQATAPVCGN